MITSKELQYVNSWTKKTPMPGVEYSAKVMEEMKTCYELFNKLLTMLDEVDDVQNVYHNVNI